MAGQQAGDPSSRCVVSFWYIFRNVGVPSRYEIPSRGFTLVQILVVLGILALLAALILPVLSRAREKSRQASCQAHERQIMMAVELYVQDADGYFPKIYHAASLPIVAWYEQLEPYTKSRQVFQCPSDNGTAIGGNWSSGPVFRSSYAANENLMVDFRIPEYLAPAPISRVTRPSATVFLSDAGTQTEFDPNLPAVTEDSPVKDGAWILWPSLNSASATDTAICGPSLRHFGLSNVAFVDGHVKALRPGQWYSSLNDGPIVRGG